MTTLKVPGVHRRTSKGLVYYYHRATGKRIRASVDDFAAFTSEVAALNGAALPPPVVLPTSTLGGLIVAYKRSPEYANLSPDTHKCYARVFDAIQPLNGLPVDEMDQRKVLALRDGLYDRRGRWLANMAVSVLSVVLGWGVPRGYVERNAGSGVPKIRRSRKLGVANPAWTAREVAAALDYATGGLRKAIALAYYAGLRKKDVVEALRADRNEHVIERISSKPGVTISVFEARRLSAILDEPDRVPGQHLVVNELGKPYTRDGLDTLFHRLKVGLREAGLVRPGLTFHGLRKSLGKDAAAAGFSENDIAAALGQTSPASARPYTVEHRQRDGARRVMEQLEKEGKR